MFTDVYCMSFMLCNYTGLSRKGEFTYVHDARPCTQTSLQAHLVAWSRQWIPMATKSGNLYMWSSAPPDHKMSFDFGCPWRSMFESLRSPFLGLNGWSQSERCDVEIKQPLQEARNELLTTSCIKLAHTNLHSHWAVKWQQAVCELIVKMLLRSETAKMPMTERYWEPCWHIDSERLQPLLAGTLTNASIILHISCLEMTQWSVRTFGFGLTLWQRKCKRRLAGPRLTHETRSESRIDDAVGGWHSSNPWDHVQEILPQRIAKMILC